MLPSASSAGFGTRTVSRLGRPQDERPIETLEPGDPFRFDNLQGQWVYGHFIFANASRVRAMLYGQGQTTTIKGRTFTTSGDEETNLPLGMTVESLADRHQSPNPQSTGATATEAKGGPTMTDEVKAAGIIAKYNHQHKQLNKALEMGDAAKAEVAQTRIDALEAEATAAGVELPTWDTPEPAAAQPAAAATPTSTPVIDAAGKKGVEMAKAKAAAAKAGGTLTKAAAKIKAKTAPKQKKLKKTHDCLCGCGGETFGLFAPGHDARVKGILLKIERGDMGKEAVPETVAPFVKWIGKWKTEGFKLTAAPVKVPGRDEIENTSLKALEALDV